MGDIRPLDFPVAQRTAIWMLANRFPMDSFGASTWSIDPLSFAYL